jgi:hypothetical protein
VCTPGEFCGFGKVNKVCLREFYESPKLEYIHVVYGINDVLIGETW